MRRDQTPTRYAAAEVAADVRACKCTVDRKGACTIDSKDTHTPSREPTNAWFCASPPRGSLDGAVALPRAAKRRGVRSEWGSCACTSVRLGGPGLSPLALGGEGGPRGSERTDDDEMPTTDSEGGSGAELLTAVAAVDDGSGNPREPKGLPTVQSSSAKSRAARNSLPELYSGQSPGVFIDQLPATSGAFHFRFSNRGNGPSTFHFQQPGARAGQEVYTIK